MAFFFIMRFLYWCIAAAYALCFLPGIVCSQPPGPGDLFPDFSHVNNLTAEECAYLGIDPDDDFHLGSLSQDLVILEFMNVFCDVCREDVELYNELYDISRGESAPGGGFAVLGIAVGNSFEEIMQFSDELVVRYPILLDTERDILELTGSVRGAPQTFVLQRQDGRYVIRHFSRSAAGRDEYLAMLSAYSKGASAQAFAYCFMIDGVKHTEKQFAGSRVVLYFPHAKTYPHASDTRNTARQVAVLRRVLELHPDIKVIVVEPEGTGRNILQGIGLPQGITRATGDQALFDRLAQPDHPTVYYIDAGGSAVFKGQALTFPALQSMVDGRYRAEPDMAEADIISLITRTLRARDVSVIDTVKTELNGSAVFRTRTNSPERFYYSRLESSPSLCDLCHDSHFIYSIDAGGSIVAFIPVWLPKRGNVIWSDEEIARFRTAFADKSIFDTFPFNAGLDAVTGATITSSIVYDGINRGKAIFSRHLQPVAGPHKDRPLKTSSSK